MAMFKPLGGSDSDSDAGSDDADRGDSSKGPPGPPHILHSQSPPALANHSALANDAALDADDTCGTDDEHMGGNLNDTENREYRGDLRDRFAALKARRAAVTKRSTARRTKKLKKQALDAVRDSFTDPADIIVFEEYGVRKEHLLSHKGSANVSNANDNTNGINANSHRAGKSAHRSQSFGRDGQSELAALAPFIDINSRLNDSRIDREIQAAITAGDFELADRLNTRAAHVETEEKLAEARRAREFMEQTEATEKARLSTRRPKLKWLFEARKKWETKGNM